MNRFARPSLPEIHSVLRKHDGLIVHFSGTPKGAGSDFEERFPDDLKKVIGGYGHSGLSTSVVMPKDEFRDCTRANATGCIGVVLGLTSPQSILDAHPHDCGSSMLDGARQTPNARDMTIDDIEATITSRANAEYNEWVVANYTVIGLFAAPPFRVSEYLPIDFPKDMPPYLIVKETSANFSYLSIEKIEATFPDMPIYSFVEGVLVQRDPSGWRPIAHSTLYT
jgi:hypothetical protein